MRALTHRDTWSVLLLGGALTLSCKGETVRGDSSSESSWGEPVLLDTGDLGSRHVAMNEAGAAVAAWNRLDAFGNEYELYASLYTPGAGWSEAALLAVHSDGMRVAIDDDGNALVIWQDELDTDPPVPSIWARRYTVGIGWEATEPVNADRTVHGSLWDIAMAPDGSALALWSEFIGDEHAPEDWLLLSSYYQPGEGWGSAVQIASGTEPWQWELQLDMNPSGNALVVWRQPTGEFDVDLAETIRSSHSASGSEWTTPESIQSEVGRQADDPEDDANSTPDAAIDPQGNGIALWSQFNDDSWKLWANRFDATGGWEGAELLSAGGDATNTSLDMDAEGNAVAIWAESHGDDCSIWSRRSTLESGWEDPEPIGPAGDGPCLHVHVVAGAAGDAIATWWQLDSYWSNRYTPGVGWSEAEAFDHATHLAIDGRDVAVDGDGNAMVVFVVAPSDAPEDAELWVNMSPRSQ